MRLQRGLAVLLLAASLSGGALAQGPGAVDDETIFHAVEQALQEARSLASANIIVRSRDGFVTLSGTAPTLVDIATAGRLASRVRGVTGVINHIRVADRASRA